MFLMHTVNEPQNIGNFIYIILIFYSNFHIHTHTFKQSKYVTLAMTTASGKRLQATILV